MSSEINLSVLLPVGFNSNPLSFSKTLESIVRQKAPAKEIVIVKDGNITMELDQVIYNYIFKYHSLFKVVIIHETAGFAKALQIGVENCRFDYIARIEIGDIAKTDRFKKQISYIKKHKDSEIVDLSDYKESNIEKYVDYKKQTGVLFSKNIIRKVFEVING